MKLQVLFDTVSAHLLKQAARSAHGLRCLYRGPGGRKCAVGCLIPDEKYTSNIEGMDVTCHRVQSVLPNLGKKGASLLLDLQIIHDTDDPKIWRGALTALAKRWELDYDCESNV